MSEADHSLPKSVVEFAVYLANYAAGYDNHLKWNEVAKFKADLNNSRAIWLRVHPGEFEDVLLEAGMYDKDVVMLSEYLRRVQRGGRVVPQRTYRDYRWTHIDTP